MRTLTLSLREVEKNGETYSSIVKVDIDNAESIEKVLLGAYLRAKRDIEKYQMQSELAEQEFNLRKRTS